LLAACVFATGVGLGGMTEGLDQEDVLVLAQARGAGDEEKEALLEAPTRGLAKERAAMMGGRDGGGGGGAVVVVGDEDDSNRLGGDGAV
jgi:hypothetical protein